MCVIFYYLEVSSPIPSVFRTSVRTSVQVDPTSEPECMEGTTLVKDCFNYILISLSNVFTYYLPI